MSIQFPPKGHAETIVISIGDDWQIGEAIRVGNVWSVYGYYRHFSDNSLTGNVVDLGEVELFMDARKKLHVFNYEQLKRTEKWRSMSEEERERMWESNRH